MTEEFRTETDSLGEMQVPADAYWGAQTQRAVENFPISGLTFGRRFIRALGVIKKAAAGANQELGLLDEQRAQLIRMAAEEVMEGTLDEQFPVDVFQTGSGTSSNMNANEVIANRAVELAADEPTAVDVHPNDHVNFGQSSNDVIPTAMHIAALEGIETELVPGLRSLAQALDQKSVEFEEIVKTGRTHLQDATPVRLGQEFGGYQTQVSKGIDRIEASEEHLRELALGGTAVGTGLNTAPEFPALAAARISEEIGIDVREADDHFEAQAAHDAMAAAHGAIRTTAGSINKIANDLRLLASGPRNGLGELDQPENQPGSSIMPGKVNPVIAEALNQVHTQIVGNDAAVAAGAADGALELNLYKPVIAYNFLQSTRLLANGATVFGDRFVGKLRADEQRSREQVDRSMALATALNPSIGYDAAAKVAKTALEEGRTVREVVIAEGHLTAAQADSILDPERMTRPGILDEE